MRQLKKKMSGEESCPPFAEKNAHYQNRQRLRFVVRLTVRALFLLTTILMKTMFSLLLTAATLLAEPKPNIVFILVDDLGVRDLSGEGSTFYETPHIDALARNSMRFTNGYSTCQVCSPSRASLLTGQYPPRNGITDWIGAQTGEDWNRNDKLLPPPNADALPLDAKVLPEVLADNGYATWFLGKWHLGGPGSYPEDHGFQINVGGFEAGGPVGGFFAPFANPKIPQEPALGTSLPLYLAAETSRLIRDHEAKTTEQPFFAYLSFYSVHSPIQTTKELWTKYQRKAAAGGKVTERFTNDRTLPVRVVQDCPIYAGMMEAVDEAVGRVIATIKAQNLENETIIVFTGDNGGVTSGDAFATAALPLRGGKGRQWEGGIRAPYYIKVPGLTKAGNTSDTPVTGTDFFPTLLDLAGLDLLPSEHVDGVSLKPLLQGQPIAQRPLFWHYPHYGNQGGEPCTMIRMGDWKLIAYHEDDRLELYNLAKDPGESNDLAANRSGRVAAMVKVMEQLKDETGAIMPARDPRYNSEEKKKERKRLRTSYKERLEKEHANYVHPDYVPNKTWWGSIPQD